MFLSTFEEKIIGIPKKVFALKQWFVVNYSYKGKIIKLDNER